MRHLHTEANHANIRQAEWCTANFIMRFTTSSVRLDGDSFFWLLYNEVVEIKVHLLQLSLELTMQKLSADYHPNMLSSTLSQHKRKHGSKVQIGRVTIATVIAGARRRNETPTEATYATNVFCCGKTIHKMNSTILDCAKYSHACLTKMTLLWAQCKIVTW